MTHWSLWLGIALGGALGALARAACLWAAEAVTAQGNATEKAAARYGLLVANTLGCFGIGLLVGGVSSLPEWLFHSLAVGVCGSLTTFSTLCAQWVQQARESAGVPKALIQLGLNLAFGYAALSAGLAVGA